MLDEYGNAYTKNVMWPELLLQRRIAMWDYVPGPTLLSTVVITL
jgi:hypothetical protein